MCLIRVAHAHPDLQVFVNEKKFAWWGHLKPLDDSYMHDHSFFMTSSESCIKGHRSSSCKHTDRPLYEIKKKGRPVSQCDKCRELRQSKKLHSKCICNSIDGRGSRPNAEAASGSRQRCTRCQTWHIYVWLKRLQLQGVDLFPSRLLCQMVSRMLHPAPLAFLCLLTRSREVSDVMISLLSVCWLGLVSL